MKKRREIAAVLCAVLLLILAFSAAYIVIEAGHNCTGEGCPICQEIQVCRQILNTVGTVLVSAVIFLGVFILFTAVLHMFFWAAPAITLISLKVKLSD